MDYNIGVNIQTSRHIHCDSQWIRIVFPLLRVAALYGRAEPSPIALKIKTSV